MISTRFNFHQNKTDCSCPCKFFISYLVVPMPTFGTSVDSLTHQMLVTAHIKFNPKVNGSLVTTLGLGPNVVTRLPLTLGLKLDRAYQWNWNRELSDCELKHSEKIKLGVILFYFYKISIWTIWQLDHLESKIPCQKYWRVFLEELLVPKKLPSTSRGAEVFVTTCSYTRKKRFIFKIFFSFFFF